MEKRLLRFSEAERRRIADLAQKTLWTEERDAKEQLEYLRVKRKLSDEVIRKFEFGHIPERVTLRCGADSDGSGGVDMSGRIIMPYRDAYGELFMLSSRDRREDAYLPHFHESVKKEHQLYGLHIAKTNIIRKKKAVVVEGQFDVAYLHSIGFDIAVGMLGSAMSIWQLILLSRYCSEIYLLFDGDEAGVNATRKTMNMYREHRLHLHRIQAIPTPLPDNTDPDEYDAQSLLKLFKEAKKRADAHAVRGA